MTRLGIAMVVLAGCRQPQQQAAPPPPEAVVQPATVDPNFIDEQVVSGLATPTQMAFTPDGRLFVCELGGKVRVIKNGALLATPFLTLTVDTQGSAGERGLLGIAIDPGFASNHFVYVYYTATAPTIHNRVARYVANGDVVSTAAPVVLMDLDDLGIVIKHNGGGMQFGNDGRLYIGVGENTVGTNSQDLNTRRGKLLRVDGNGNPPSDNPFFNTVTGVNRAIWAYGLRNPYTFAFRPSDGILYINDVGNNMFEEIDLGLKGANYDWPNTEGPTTNPGTVTPIYSYANTRNPDCAIVGGTFYEPSVQQFPASYVGQYFFADFCGGWIRKFDPATHTATGFATGAFGPVDLDVGPLDGFLYYLNHDNGTLRRIRFATNQAPVINAPPASATVGLGQTATFTVAASGSGTLTYQWQRGTTDIPGATSSSYTTDPVTLADDGATFRVVVTNAFGTRTSTSATLTVLNNQPPTASIDQPVDGSLYTAGTAVSYAGSANDPETGALMGPAFTWRIDFHHANHVHPFQGDTTGSTSGTFTPPRNDETDSNVFYRIYLTVKDPAGLTTQVVRDIHPRVANITLVTNPPGLTVTLDGAPKVTPLTVAAVVGMNRAIGAPSPQSLSGTTYSFASWSDSGAAAHNITVPATDTTFTATFTTGVNAFLESGGQAVVEAEHFTGSVPGTGGASGATWSEQSATGASGTELIALPNSGVNTGDTTNGPRRDYAIKFVTTGTYQVWVRSRGPTGADDSVHVGLNGTITSTGGQGVSNGTALAWKNTVTGSGTPLKRATVTVSSAGVATLNLWMREDGVEVDRLLLTTNASLTPSGTGPAESPRNMPPPPPPPADTFTASDGMGKANLAWTYSGSGQTGFKIERKAPGETTFTLLTSAIAASARSFTDSPLTAGTYSYQLKATNASGDSAPLTATVDVTAPPPPPPPPPADTFTASDGVGKANLAWTYSGSGQTGFKIDRKAPGETTFTPLTTTGASARSFTDSPLAAGTYSYQLKATNASGDSAALTATVNVTATPPGPSITNLVVNDSTRASFWSIQSNFQVGAVPFGDRTYTVDPGVNAALLGGPWIRTSADSKNFTTEPVATFTATGSFVYLIVDNRWNGTGGKPAFIDGTYTDAGFDVTVRQSSTAAFPYSVWRKPIGTSTPVSLPHMGATTAPYLFVVVK